MCDYLFAYGTLQTGLAPPEIAHAIEALRPVGNATVPGLLYDLGAYPGAVLDPSSNRIISGIVLQLPQDSRVLAEIDQYEEFDPGSPETSPFVRIPENVTLDSGRRLKCWIYIYNRDPMAAPVLEDGNFSLRPR